jgi:transcriptional regulator with XRE-family HTH domain
MRLGEVLRKWRRASDLGVREAAKELGISHGTLSRIERGENMDGETLAKVLRWLMEAE